MVDNLPIRFVKSATIVPMQRQWPGAFSICDANGAPVPEAATSVKHSILHPRYVTAQERAQSKTKTGRHLYGGFMLPHFGHYVLETLSRSWALNFLDKKPESIVFLQYNGNDNAPPKPPFPEVLSILGIDIPFEYITEPTTFDELIVPQQGLGMGVNASGIAQHRNFLSQKFSNIASKGRIPKLYISRTGYNLRRGGYLAEAWFEEELQKQGYTVFHPQEVSFEEQIATYLASDKIISADNSALHVVGMIGRANQDIAIVLRRHHGVVDLQPQLSVSHGKEPLVINAIQKVHCLDSRKPVNWGHFAEIDYKDVFRELLKNGFVNEMPDNFDTIHQISQKELMQKQRRHGGKYNVVTDMHTRQVPNLVAPYF